MKPFDLEKALAGEPVRDLSGNKRYILKHPENGYLVTYAMDNIAVCCSTIWYKNINQDEFSMFGMYEEPRPTVTLTLPAPIKTAHHNQEVFKRGNSTIIRFYFDANRDKHRKILESGSLFYSEEDAQAWLDAMKNARR
ncbi:TPA: pyruvate kinase [Pasteurella multocida]|nr:pyruvate kinase [Pasteurella multocida]HDR1266117.1 pyruvate kinase [Pasteurella multocida]HDR1434210.1 pyruvate kinase [Pasteurella multocida]